MTLRFFWTPSRFSSSVPCLLAGLAGILMTPVRAAEAAFTGSSADTNYQFGATAPTNKVNYTVAVYEKGKARKLSQAEAESIGLQVVELLGSCKDREKKLTSESDWKNALSSHRCVHIQFLNPTTITVKARGPTTITEIMLPLDKQDTGRVVLARNGSDIYSPFSAHDQRLLNSVVRALDSTQ